MIKRLTLSYFKQHIDRVIDFGPGINAIRAPNGSGKSNVLLAIAYALFGHKALPETLEDTVTYGEPLNKLKVVLEFEFAGVDYTMSRGKSGAELTFGKERITGQTETIKFVERLLGVSADMASKLMLARQKSVGGALAGGPSVAGKTIEDLAGLGLIEEIIEAMQSQLVSGATTGVESRIALLAAQAVEVVAVDLQPLEKAVADAQGVLGDKRGDLASLSGRLDDLDVVQANQILADEIRLSQACAARATKIENLKALLAEPLPVAPESEAIDAVRAKIEAQRNLAAAARVHAELKVATVDVLWDEPRAALDTAIAAGRIRLRVLIDEARSAEDALNSKRIAGQNRTRDLEQAIQLAQIKAIKDSTCAFCQKDLTDVPEVVKINADVTAEVLALELQLNDHKEALTGELADLKDALDGVNGNLNEQGEECRQLDEVVKADDRMSLVLARAADYITVDRSVVPARWTWTGPTDAPQDFAGELAALVAQDKAATAAAATAAAGGLQLADLQAQQDADTAARGALELVEAQDTLDQENVLKPQISAARAGVETAADALHFAQGALATAKVANEQGAKVSAAAKAQLALSQAELDEMLANNALVKKLRACRPQITDRLWSLVLSAVTLYFSQIRGQHSAITRADSIFKCNGNPVSGLSGAEEDILGLAVRLSLVKTFLPSVDFMILDEVASACDDQRESAMLGLLSTVGFGQVILVSHADIVDSFADSVIQLN